MKLLGAYPLLGDEVVVRLACDIPAGFEPVEAHAGCLTLSHVKAQALWFDANGTVGADKTEDMGATPRDTTPRRVIVSVHLPGKTLVARVQLVLRSNTGKTRTLSRLVRRGEFLPPLRQWIVERTNAPDDPRHDAWMRAHQPSQSELASQRAAYEAGNPELPVQSVNPANHPFFSIITPVFRTPPDYLRAMIDSVLAQTYGSFELVLVNASGEYPQADELNALLESYDDPRIRILTVENKGIAVNTNVGIAAAVGDYVAFVDHDDFIEPDALYHYARAIAANPQTDLLFCDEDLYGSADGEDRFYGVRFKPGWNPDLLFTHNYVCHMLCVSRHAIELTQRSGDDVTAAQDYDLTLKTYEIARSICHVPRVLYHWRVHEKSTAVNRASKPYAQEAGRLAVQHHFERIGIPATVTDGAFPFSYRVHYKLPANDKLPHVTVAILSTGANKAGLARLQASLKLLDWPADKLDVRVLAAVDRDAFFESIRSTGANTDDLIMLLDDGCEIVCADMLREQAAILLNRKDVAVVAPELLYPDDMVRSCGLFVRRDGTLGHPEHMLSRYDDGYMSMLLHARDCSALPPQGILMRKSTWAPSTWGRGICALDAAIADLCLTFAEQGRYCVVQPYAPLRVWGPGPIKSLTAAQAKAQSQAQAQAQSHILLQRHPALAANGDPLIDPLLDEREDLFKARHATASSDLAKDGNVDARCYKDMCTDVNEKR